MMTIMIIAEVLRAEEAEIEATAVEHLPEAAVVVPPVAEELAIQTEETTGGHLVERMTVRICRIAQNRQRRMCRRLVTTCQVQKNISA